jgi:pimeloyl-ACP methyl ester carboxylesterase
MSSPEPFTIAIPEATLQDIRRRVAEFPWHEMPVDGGWEYGANLDYMKSLCQYWLDEYDWREHEAALNQFSHFKAPVDDGHDVLDVHYIYEKGSGPNPVPLLINHGWPGSVVEFMKLIEPLAHPERFGGNVEDAFDVVAPSLPGFGFSGAPPRPFGPRRIAGHLSRLMTDVLGYPKYLAQGGDWGAGVASWLGYDHAPACQAIHINVIVMQHSDGPQTAEEREWSARWEDEQIMQHGYRTQQATRPQTLSYAMMDSPVGVAAWIVEKFHDWSDIRNDDVETAHSKDTMLTNIMVYLVTRTFNTASWIYYGRREEGGRCMSHDGTRVEVPTAAALFPAEMLSWPPRSYVERMYNITRWTEMPHGGHFAALEAPEHLLEDIRAFARTLR